MQREKNFQPKSRNEQTLTGLSHCSSCSPTAVIRRCRQLAAVVDELATAVASSQYISCTIRSRLAGLCAEACRSIAVAGNKSCSYSQKHRSPHIAGSKCWICRRVLWIFCCIGPTGIHDPKCFGSDDQRSFHRRNTFHDVVALSGRRHRRNLLKKKDVVK